MKTISVSETVHSELVKVAAEIQQKTGKYTDLNTALQELLAQRHGKKP